MANATDFFLLLLRQFAGGPGPIENNLVRFGLPAILWGMLLLVAWSRQRTRVLPREKLLTWGFGLGFARELFMFVQVSERLLGRTNHIEGKLHQPIEHALAMAAIIVVAAAFLRYILDEQRLSSRYLWIGLGATVAGFGLVAWTWPRELAANPDILFHQTWGAWLFHLPLSISILGAIVFLGGKRGWLRNVVILALVFFFLGEVLMLTNYATDRGYATIVCPIGNLFHILAIPLLGYVYLREQAIEKKRAERALEAYRDHLEDLVTERTEELTTANTRLAAQNAVAATLSRSLDLDTILNESLETTLTVLNMQAGLIFLIHPNEQSLAAQVQRGEIVLGNAEPDRCVWHQISTEAVTQMQAVVFPNIGESGKVQPACASAHEMQTLVSTPLISKGKAVGALTLGARQTNAIQQAGLELLTAIGQQVGLAVEHAHLYQEAERRAKELTLLHQASVFLTSTLDEDEIYGQIVEQAPKLVDCPAACVLLWPEREREIEIVAAYGMEKREREILRTQLAGSDLPHALVSSDESIAIEDTRRDARVPAIWRERLQIEALLCVPIWMPADSPGFLLLIDRRTSRQWQAKEIELIESFISRAAAALMNAHLHKQLEWAAALEERQRIAANMHDGLGQTLSLLGLCVDRATDLANTGSVRESPRELYGVRELIEQASHDVRRSIASLQERPRPRRSLQDQLDDLLEQLPTERTPSIRSVVEMSEPLFLAPEQEEQILPVVQEALLNACYHAQATQITVKLERHADHIRITVQDDGKGFDLTRVHNGSEGHFGLSIMRARAARIGAELEVDSRPGRGTQVRLTWPQVDRKQEMRPILSPTPALEAEP